MMQKKYKLHEKLKKKISARRELPTNAIKKDSIKNNASYFSVG